FTSVPSSSKRTVTRLKRLVWRRLSAVTWARSSRVNQRKATRSAGNRIEPAAAAGSALDALVETRPAATDSTFGARPQGVGPRPVDTRFYATIAGGRTMPTTHLRAGACRRLQPAAVAPDGAAVEAASHRTDCAAVAHGLWLPSDLLFEPALKQVQT